MKLTASVENVYVGGPSIVNTFTADVEPPFIGEDLYDWGQEVLFPFTGTGREDGDASYFLTITECDDLDLVGVEFEWGL